MRTDYLQKNYFATVTTPFGDDTFLVDAMEASEAISQPFRITMQLKSGKTDLLASKILGNSVSVVLAVPDGPKRYFNGIASRFLHSGGDRYFSYYSVEVVPKLWLLKLTRARVVWQEKTAAEIIKAVLGEHGITFSDKLTKTYEALDYCVQYDETDFDFISRLMEQQGIFFFFTFTSSAHTMVLADAASAHAACTDAGTVRFLPADGTRHMIDTVATFEIENRLVTKTYAVGDYDPIKPSTSLLAESAGATGKGEFDDWPGRHATAAGGTALAKLRVEAGQLEAEVLRGAGYVYPFCTGTKFKLTGHFRTSLNAEYVLRKIWHRVQQNRYSNSFDAFPSDVSFRAPGRTPLPRAAGSETALVVGPKGEEIWTDKHGRIKIQFHWDQLGKKDETSSCWVRVSQAAAGKGFGALFLPRVGQEVIVSYLDGNPDRPLVTGSVYNGENATPVTLPANQTQSVIRTRSVKAGKEGNEIRLEDKLDSEEFYLHAQKDMKIEIENDLTTTLTKGAEIHTLTEGDRTIELKKGKEIHKVKSTRAVTVTGDETHKNEAAFTHEVTGAYKLKVTGDLVIEAGGSVTIKAGTTVAITAGTTLTNKAGTALTNEAGTALTNKAGTALTNQAATGLTNKSSMSLINEAGTTLDNKGLMITSKASAMQTVDGGGMLTLKGGLVMIN